MRLTFMAHDDRWQLLRVLGCSLLVALPPVCGALVVVWVHQDVVRLGYALSDEEKRARQLRVELERLRVEWAAEVAPNRLSKRAAALGMRPPQPAERWQAGPPRLAQHQP